MLCTKTLAAPPCAVATVVAAFEFVYLMDKHYLRRGKTTLVGAFARRVLTLVDIQRHFFYTSAFARTAGFPAAPRPGRPRRQRPWPASVWRTKFNIQITRF